ncbi:VC0807 family protein [Paraburkholderia humisilvae]|uniref:Intracellular septation protein A n=1 Tax=Paraburkholderia humisilvae TaxID=627669 RepID=A0A6J5FAL0_9BURK|nr:VC0807 family protein [Paraburkholderia humisilvae]CAB3774497.1 hypothetical protein LMG29542_07874 [Paraburkholderia humisilvae]
MKRRIFIELLIYLGLPLLSWNLLRGHMSDYGLILVGLVPGLLYTIATVVLKKEWSVSGVFFLVVIVLNLLVDLASSNANQALWNPVWLSCTVLTFYMLTMLLKRPLGMFFFIDYAHGMGVPRERARMLYRHPRNIHHFYKFTVLLMLHEIASIAIRSVLLNRYGVNGYNQIQVSTSVVNYVFTGFTIIYVIYIQQHIDRTVLPSQPAPIGE